MLISWSTKKQITYFLFFVLVLVGFFALVWIKMSEPTCFDNKKNQKEKGVDCGGPCNKECLGVVRELNILWSKPLRVKGGNYDAIAMVENLNTALMTDSAKYQFRLYDERNILIASKEGEMFITPAQKFTVFEANINTGNRIPSRAVLEFEKNIKWKLYKGGFPNLIISKKDYSDSPRASLSAVVSNKSLDDVEGVVATAILYDEEDNATAASAVNVEGVKGNSNIEVFFSWPESYGDKHVRDEIFLRTKFVPNF